LDPAVELTGLAERLHHAADHAEPGAARATRELALLALALTLRGLVLSPTVRTAVEPFLSRVGQDAGRGQLDPESLRHAATELTSAASGGTLAALAERLASGTSPVPHSPPIVPIEALAPGPDPVPIESLLLPPLLPFEQSFSTWYALKHRERAPTPEPAPVPIETLLLRGRRALERADQVRRELDVVLRRQSNLVGVEPLLAELLDLVPLALDEAR